MWVGMSAPATCVYVPFYAGITRLPQAYTIGVPHKYDRKSAFWTFHHLSKWAQLDYIHMIKEIKRVQNEIESAELNRQQAIDEESFSLYQKDPVLAKEFLTKYCINNAEYVLETWRELSDLLVANYGVGSINPPKAPEWWRKVLLNKEK
jgi:dipeptidase